MWVGSRGSGHEDLYEIQMWAVNEDNEYMCAFTYLCERDGIMCGHAYRNETISEDEYLSCRYQLKQTGARFGFYCYK